MRDKLLKEVLLDLNYSLTMHLEYTFRYRMIRQGVHSHSDGEVVEVVQELIETTEFLERNADLKV